PARLVGQRLAREELRQSHRVERLAEMRKLGDRFVDELMDATVEILGHQTIGNRIVRAVVEHQADEHRLLSLDRVRWNSNVVDNGLVASPSRAYERNLCFAFSHSR